MIKERKLRTFNGYSAIVVLFILQILGFYLNNLAIEAHAGWWIPVSLLFDILVFVCWFGLFMVHPNQGRVAQLFGTYMGTEKTTGLRWANPLYIKQKLSLRIRNFESEKLKVNDNRGNPIEIAAVVVWYVTDTAEASFEVDDYESFVSIQSEAALRNMATSYPYDQHEDGETALRSHAVIVAQKLKEEIQERLDKAGVSVIEARISHLAYAPEIANAMLQRQQASAIIAARTLIVEGAVSMVHMALEKLKRDNIVELDAERKAAMVSNLLVVLCGDRNTQPVINTGTLYS
ncbi:MAG: SPFH domain-containing protein [Gammaproteobacteria bacterium]|nr:MAG: SPFH domain-containing protein [Gammaproteobacteria bacterium]